MIDSDLPLSGIENEADIPFLGSWKETPKNWNAHLGLTPTEAPDPEEFWKDEPDKADGYANVYLAIDDFYDGDRWIRSIRKDVEEWLNKNAGPRRCYGLDWYQNPQDYDWHVRGDVHRNGKNMVQICVRDLKMAMFLKLKFGGK